MVNWAEVTVAVTVIAGTGGLVYQVGRLTQKVDDMAERISRLEQVINGGGRTRPGQRGSRNPGR